MSSAIEAHTKSTDDRPNVESVRELFKRYSNWGRWGKDDQRGTLNHVTPEHVLRAAGCIRSGKRFSMALPFDSDGPQTGGLGRFNPIHLMFRDGGDAVTGAVIEDFYNGIDRNIRGTDDMIIMPLQSGTQWDALSHIIFDGALYNGYKPERVSSKGAAVNDITQARDQIAGRGVLLDIARHQGRDALPPGHAITASQLEDCARDQGVDVGQGDFILVRTGMMGERRGRWGDFAGGPAPGLGLDTVPWIAEKEVAGLATDTWGMEVLPNETPDVFQPLHCILLVGMGLYIGEIFDLEELADDSAADGQYDFFFCAPPLPFTRAVGSPVNPMAIK